MFRSPLFFSHVSASKGQVVRFTVMSSWGDGLPSGPQWCEQLKMLGFHGDLTRKNGGFTQENGDVMRFQSDLMGFHGVLIHQNGEFGDLMVIEHKVGPPNAMFVGLQTPATIVIGIINHSEIGVVFTNLAIDRGHHFV